MKQFYMIIDVALCENCNNCFLACKDEHCGNHWQGYAASQPLHGHRWMNILRRERGHFPVIDVAHLPKPCMHCRDAPCIAAAANRAIYRREDGIVIIDPDKARGQRQLVDACPYGSIWWNEEARLAQKCTLCAHLLDKSWRAPRCVQACPTGALRLEHGEPLEVEEMIKAQGLEILAAQNNVTRPRVFYRNLQRFTHCFIAGSVAMVEGDTVDCAAGAQVRLFRGDRRVDRQKTDEFGDFKFDGLQKDSGAYRVQIDYLSFPSRTIGVELGASQVLEEIRFGAGLSYTLN